MKAPDDHHLLRTAWVLWNLLIAVPVTAIAYTVAWLHQHPVRAIPTYLAAAALTAVALTTH